MQSRNFKQHLVIFKRQTFVSSRRCWHGLVSFWPKTIQKHNTTIISSCCIFPTLMLGYQMITKCLLTTSAESNPANVKFNKSRSYFWLSYLIFLSSQCFERPILNHEYIFIRRGHSCAVCKRLRKFIKDIFNKAHKIMAGQKTS